MKELSPREAATALSHPLAVANRLRPVLLHLNRELRRELRDLEISGVQIALLASIRQHPGIGLTDLAGKERMTTASLSTHIDRLEAAKFVGRAREDATDRRRVGLHITDQGEVLLDQVRSRRTSWLAEGLELLDPLDLTAIEAAIDPLIRLLETRP
jgi:DNA-binding MarR family transcriptional regulator